MLIEKINEEDLNLDDNNLWDEKDLKNRHNRRRIKKKNVQPFLFGSNNQLVQYFPQTI